jgi:predicted O-linked N-acetylglucosamine transferase (SPINDLY family)
VKAFNYAIADDYCIRGDEEADYVEKVFRMPTGTICAWDMGAPPVVAPPPCLEKGYVTFGCFADFFKIGDGVLEAWVTLLKRVPDARLYLKSNNLRLRIERDRVAGFFAERGIAAERLIMEGLSTLKQMKKCYEWVDIAVDTFPYSSGSTTINALWQGVPVIAIDGEDWRGRTAAAVLAGAQLDEFIARDVGDYINKACTLAASPARLAGLRATLGRRMASSPQWDVKTFARNFETRLRMTWQDWLKTTEPEKKSR